MRRWGGSDAMMVLRLMLAALLIATASRAMADPVTVEGLPFSDELGSFRLVSVTGKGTIDEPFVVTEEITGPNDPTLVIKNFSQSFGNRVGTQHTAAFAMEKIVINKTSKTWQGFQVELREIQNRPSTYEDGLSFG